MRACVPSPAGTTERRTSRQNCHLWTTGDCDSCVITHPTTLTTIDNATCRPAPTHFPWRRSGSGTLANPETSFQNLRLVGCACVSPAPPDERDVNASQVCPLFALWEKDHHWSHPRGPSSGSESSVPRNLAVTLPLLLGRHRLACPCAASDRERGAESLGRRVQQVAWTGETALAITTIGFGKTSFAHYHDRFCVSTQGGTL